MSRFCVVEGTKITLNDKETIPIESIKVGQEILSFDLNTLQKSQKYDILVKMKTNKFDGIFHEDLVKNVWKNTAEEYYLINDKLKITKDHIVMAKRDKTYYWTKVENLLLNDYLFTELNIFERIESIIIVKEKVKVFNLEVNRVFNYFANSYLIHNGAPCTACAACGAQGITSFTLNITVDNLMNTSIRITIDEDDIGEEPIVGATPTVPKNLPVAFVFNDSDYLLDTSYEIKVEAYVMSSWISLQSAGGSLTFTNVSETTFNGTSGDLSYSWDGENDGDANVTFTSAVSSATFTIES